MDAFLHHLQLGSPDPARLAGFYDAAFAMTCRILPGGRRLCRGRERSLLLAEGPPKTLGFAAYAFANRDDLESMRARLARLAIPISPSPSPLFGPAAFALRDPDGNRLVFGLADEVVEAEAAPDGLPARLQHLVVASTSCATTAGFYSEILGFKVSDRVHDAEGRLMTVFLRSNREHHSFAVFQAPENRFDHYSCEAGDWGLIRDWADHFAALRVPIEWGPGRHGPGNNLFFFVHDCDGNWVELSAEIEIIETDRPAGTWPHEERTLNAWGRGMLRS